jgi:hypothetical protein
MVALRVIARGNQIRRNETVLCALSYASWLATQHWPAQYQQSYGVCGLPSKMRVGSRAFPGVAHKQVSHALTRRVLRSNVPRGGPSIEVSIYRPVVL